MIRLLLFFFYLKVYILFWLRYLVLNVVSIYYRLEWECKSKKLINKNYIVCKK